MCFKRRATLRPASSDSSSNMIPLINVVLLLLIFFMIAGQFKRPAETGIILPDSTNPEEGSQDSIELSLSAGGEIRWNGAPLTAAAVVMRLRQTLAASDESHVVAGDSDIGNSAVAARGFSLLADRGVSISDFNALLALLHDGGLMHVKLVTNFLPDNSAHR